MLQHGASSGAVHGTVVVADGLSCPEAGVILAPQPGAESELLALEGRLLTTGPPVKSLVKDLEMRSSWLG